MAGSGHPSVSGTGTPATGFVDALRLVIYLTEEDRAGRRPAWKAVLDRAREDGMAGATVWRGVEGFGARGYLRSDRYVDAAQGLPLVIEVVDLPARVRSFLPAVRALVPDALMTLQAARMSAGRPDDELRLDDPLPRPEAPSPRG